MVYITGSSAFYSYYSADNLIYGSMQQDIYNSSLFSRRLVLKGKPAPVQGLKG